MCLHRKLTFIQDVQTFTQKIKTNTKYDKSFCVFFPWFFQIDVHYQFMGLFFFSEYFWCRNCSIYHHYQISVNDTWKRQFNDPIFKSISCFLPLNCNAQKNAVVREIHFFQLFGSFQSKICKFVKWDPDFVIVVVVFTAKIWRRLYLV